MDLIEISTHWNGLLGTSKLKIIQIKGSGNTLQLRGRATGKNQMTMVSECIIIALEK